MSIDRAATAEYLRALARRIESGHGDQVFVVVHKLDRDGNLVATSTDLQGATNHGAAFAIEALASRIVCCAGCLPGSAHAAVDTVFAQFEAADDVAAVAAAITGLNQTTRH